MKGYKAFDKNLQCRGMQYEIGRTYELKNIPICCKRGFHFCKSISDCYRFYDMTDETRICEVEALGEIVTDDGIKYCTDKIHVIREIENPRVKSNANDTSSGFCNSGDYNSGKCNSGDHNSGNWNSGIFNTEQMPTIKIFDKDSDWTIEDWRKSFAYRVMKGCPVTHSEFIGKNSMSEEEKENHPEHEILCGYMKTITVTAKNKQKWWDDLSDYDKQAVMSLPNFDADKFYQCTEIRVKV